MKGCVFFLLLLFAAKAGGAQDAGGLAQLVKSKVESFKHVIDTSGVPAQGFGYSVVLGSTKIDTADFCFSIALVSDAEELDDVFRNYYYLLEGRPVLLYLNHPSMLYLVKELGAEKINRANLEGIRSMLADFPFFWGSQPYQVCCSKNGIVSGEINFPSHEYIPVAKPEGIPLKYPGSFPVCTTIDLR